MDLIIVESPTKARTLSKFLKGKYAVEASMGHIRDLPKGELGVDVEKNFAPSYVIPRDKSKRVKELVDIASKSDNVILATDPDREGEAIAWHIAMILTQKLKSKTIKTPDDFKRIAFHEITESAINDAMKNPRKIDMNLVDAQQARRILDRLVGYKLSPLLWHKLSRRWLSAGRVQSVSVRLIVEREREIRKFGKQEFWNIEGNFISTDKKESGPENTTDQTIVVKLVSFDGKVYENQLVYELFDGKYTTGVSSITTKEETDRIIADFQNPFTIAAVDKKEIKRNPPAPFTTSTLQQEAGRRFYFSAKKTMQVAQKLYEEGLISYHRTDSVNLSEKFIDEARSFISQNYGADFVPTDARRFHTKSKVAQEAHEAIRPTELKMHSDSIYGKGDFNHDHERLYDLIWKRALASQAKEAIFDSTTIVITDAKGYRFEAQGSVIKFEGYLKIMGRESDDHDLPKVTVGETCKIKSVNPTQHFSSPPPRYTEATLVKTLEEKDIGRPSTYAPIISTIIERNYVIKEDKRMVPTELGEAVTDFLVKYFPQILNLPFTANMENSLDQVANGERNWVPVISDFYVPFAKILDDTYKDAEKVKMAEEEIDEACPLCGHTLVIRMGRYGKFIACSTFPKCGYKRQHVEKIDVKCPKCGGDMVIKKSHRGKTFYGCSNYPKCTFAAWKKEDIK
jgi:DNA topoisomerase I